MRPAYLLIIYVIGFCSCGGETAFNHPFGSNGPVQTFARPATDNISSEPIRRVLESAHEQIKVTTHYTQDYRVLSYPGGDMPADTGACTDVVIRAFRNAGVDLQKEVHEDMATNFSVYPQKWGLKATDTNIDHRRVPNLQTFFTRRGKAVAISSDGSNYQPGDVVTWDLDGKGMTHIGLVSNDWNDRDKRYLIIHNIGGGVQEEDRLFNWKITGHYRYF
jgi:uncharacterized protein YijF (DUF1287 family)